MDICRGRFSLYVCILRIMNNAQSTDLGGPVPRHSSSNTMKEALERLQGVRHSNRVVASGGDSSCVFSISKFGAKKGMLQINRTQKKGRNKPQKRHQQQKKGAGRMQMNRPRGFGVWLRKYGMEEGSRETGTNERLRGQRSGWLAHLSRWRRERQTADVNCRCRLQVVKWCSMWAGINNMEYLSFAFCV